MGSTMKRPDWFENKITLGNVLTLIPLIGAVVVAYFDLRTDAASIRSDTALLKQVQVRDTARIDKLEARDDILQTQMRDYQHQTVQGLTRLETQVGILLQDRRLPPPLGGPPR